MLTDRLGAAPVRPRPCSSASPSAGTARASRPGSAATQIPLALRIVHVARDATFQRLLGGEEHAARVIRERAGHAFDPAIAALLADDAADDPRGRTRSGRRGTRRSPREPVRG